MRWRTIAAVQQLRQAGTDPSFLLKALSEASGELRHVIYGLSRRELLRPGQGLDEDWCLLSLAVHMRECERGTNRQLEAILASRHADIPNVDLDDIPLLEDYEDEDEDDVLEEFHYLRRATAYTLWDLSEREWSRSGEHPYRGQVSVAELARELYRHDLEHLWQARRMIDASPARR